MRLFITLLLLFFSNLFLAAPQAAASPRKASVDTATAADPKKPKAPRNTRKTAAAAHVQKEPTDKKSKTASHERTKEKTVKVVSTAHEAKESKKAKVVIVRHADSNKNKEEKTTRHEGLKKDPTSVALVRRELKRGKLRHAKQTEAEDSDTVAAVATAHGRRVKRHSKTFEEVSVPLTLSAAHKMRYQNARQTAMNKLMSQIGKPYRWGGSSPYSGFDCSGLVYYAYKDLVKIPLPRTANEMFHLRDAAPIKQNELESGDLVFFRISHRGAADHVGVYLGNGRFIQSPRTGSDIRISKLNEDYWQDHYVGARRVVTPQTIR